MTRPALYHASLLTLSLLLVDCNQGQADTRISVEAVGLAGRFAVGRLTTLRATVETDDPGEFWLTLEAPDPTGNPVQFRSAGRTLAANTPEQLSVLFRTGQLGAGLRLQLVGARGPVAEKLIRFEPGDEGQAPPVSPAIHLVAAVGSPAGLDELQAPAPSDSRSVPDDTVRVLGVEPADFDVRAESFESIRTIVIAANYGFSPAQASALRDWVQFGGHLVVAAASEIEAYRTSALGQVVQTWVPVEPGLSRLAELPGLESFTDNTARVPLARRRINAARIGNHDGVTLVSGTDGPLIVQCCAGLGRVTFIGLDLTTGPLTRWDALPLLMRRIVNDDRRRTAAFENAGARLGHTGITDLSTQLHSSLEHFPEVGRPSSWVIMGFMLVYLLAVGPLDYFVVHRLLKRPRLTWVTFPSMIVLGCTAGILLAQRANGDAVRLNQIAVVDIDASATGATRVQTWIDLYNPDTRRGTIRVRPDDSVFAALHPESDSAGHAMLTWTGVPENVFGGMLRTSGIQMGAVGYTAETDIVSGLPLKIWSTRGLTTRWRGNAQPPIESELTTSNVGLLRGSLTHHLPFPIRNWILAHGLRIYWPDSAHPQSAEIRPGEVWSPQARNVLQRDLESYLTGVRTIEVQLRLGEGGEAIRQQQAAYDPLSRDPAYIVRMLSLHEAAGGTAYTGLTNTALSEFDLSGLIGLNRAVLIGEIDSATATVELDGTPVPPTRSRTFVRIVLPIRQRIAASAR